MKRSDRIYLEIERSKIKREKARIVLNKSLALYVIFMLIGILGFTFEYIDSFMLNTLIVMGIIVLLAGSAPYIIVVHREEKKIDRFLK